VRPHRLAFAVAGGHVATHGVGSKILLPHRVDHLRGDQHGHRRALLLVAFDVAEQLVVEVVAEGLFELLEVLHGVRPLPLGGLPLLGRDVPVAREPGPVRLDELTLEGIPEGLGRSVGVGLAMAGSNVRRLRLELDGHFGHPPRGSPSRG
jgi:hypothetical protein